MRERPQGAGQVRISARRVAGRSSAIFDSGHDQRAVDRALGEEPEELWVLERVSVVGASDRGERLSCVPDGRLEELRLLRKELGEERRLSPSLLGKCLYSDGARIPSRSARRRIENASRLSSSSSSRAAWRICWARVVSNALDMANGVSVPMANAVSLLNRFRELP